MRKHAANPVLWLGAIFTLATMPAAVAQNGQPSYIERSQLARSHSILLVRLESLAEPGSCAPPHDDRRIPCRRGQFQIIDVLKDSDGQGLGSGLCSADILLDPRGLVGWPSVVRIEVGLEYLVLSDRKGGGPEVLGSPELVIPVTKAEDPSTEIRAVQRFMAGSKAATVQIGEVAGMIQSSAVPYTQLTADYVVTLIQASADADIPPLIAAVEAREGPVFSNRGTGMFLGAFYGPLSRGYKAPNLLRLFVAVMARSMDGQEHDSTAPDVRKAIAKTFVPWAMGSELAMAALRATIATPTGEVFRRKARQIGASEKDFSAVERGNILGLLTALDNKK